MVSLSPTLALLTFLAISSITDRPISAQDISSFFNQMMKEFVPKNTRHYTIINGVEVDPAEGGDPSETGILSRISSNPSIGPLVKTVLSNGPETGGWLNSGPWSPSSAPSSKPASSFFSFFGGRSNSGSASPEPEPDIITVDDLRQRSGVEPTELVIKSSMSFQ